MKKIIVPIDFSKYSEYALETSAALAKKHNAQIIVIHMLELSEAVLSVSGTETQNETLFMLKLASKKFEEFLQKDYLEGIEIETIIKHHKVFDELDQVAKDIGADLIVMGSHGHSRQEGIFSGSNTAKVVRHSNIPVLIVKSKLTNVDFDNVVYATDFSEESIPAFKKALDLLSAMNSETTLLHVNLPYSNFQSTTEIKEQAKNFLEKADGNLNRLPEIEYISDYSVEAGILSYADNSKVDMITISTHGRTGLVHFFGGSISEDLVHHSTLPVLAFKM
ncbi:universal stress protein [Aquimarina sp. RZ0]|uniref:universal stress protein n=1 Tax=Aquimarina sp. RZ0 TaxID=2607730 RepID=UPI0011F0EAFC|nr:universal stress protein [Aquimarina sp. RZ0]KAA1244614.1 universal stress protein [Aquimarina sp. RZ0]